MKGIVLLLEHVSRTYQRGQETVHAVQDLSVSFLPGQLTLILGPSGGGKSTLLHLLGGMDRPTDGAFTAGSTQVTALNPDRLAQWRRRTIGFVFQNFYLLPGYSAVDNAALPLLLDGEPVSTRRARARALLDQLGLGDRAQHTPAELSGGQIQRVAIARALAHDPPVILADEPTGNLDTQSGRDIVAQLAQLAHEDGRTVIVVSHNEEFAPLADRVVRIRDGRIESDSRPAAEPPAPETGDHSPAHRGGPRFGTLVAEALHSLNRRRGRSLLTSLGVIIGVTSMVLLMSIGAGLQSQVLKAIRGASSMTTITVTPQPTSTGLTITPVVSHASGHPLDAAAIRDLARLPHVRAAYGQAELLTTARATRGSLSMVIDTLAPATAPGSPPLHLIAGHRPSRSHPGILLPESVATALFHVPTNAVSMVVGRTLTLTLNGTVSSTGLTGPVGASPAEQARIRGIVRNSLGAAGSVNAELGQAWLQTLAGPKHPVVYPEAAVIAGSINQVSGIAHTIRSKGYGATTTQSVIEQVQHTFGLIETGLGIVGGVALAVAGLMIGVVMSMAVLERRREIGVWRAIGARRRDVFALFLMEAVIIGLFGGALGDLLGWALGKGGAALFHHPGLFLVPSWLIVVGLAFGGGVAAMAGAIPANHAARLRPVDALRN